jgi:hypothetical protein
MRENVEIYWRVKERVEEPLKCVEMFHVKVHVVLLLHVILLDSQTKQIVHPKLLDQLLILTIKYRLEIGSI